jgi:hypothetical protein
VQAAIAERLNRHGMTEDRILEETRRVAFSDMGDFANWGPDGVVLEPRDSLTAEQRACVQEVIEHRRTHTDESGATVEHREIRIKLYDKLEALRLSARALGLLKDKVEVEVSGIYPPGFFEAVVSGDLSKLPPKYREAAQAALPAGPVTDAELVDTMLPGLDDEAEGSPARWRQRDRLLVEVAELLPLKFDPPQLH